MSLILNQTSAMSRKVGRKRINFERPTVRLPAGTLARVESMLRDGENPTDFFRDAIERELKRREKAKAPKEN